MDMAGSASPSLTSSSHTLTAGSTSMPPPPPASCLAMDIPNRTALLDSLSAQNRHIFLQPSKSVSSNSLLVVKNALDAFAGQVSDEQQLRLREASKKRRRATNLRGVDVLKIRKVHIEGLETGQVWQQAKRIIKSSLRESQDALRELDERGEAEEKNAKPKELQRIVGNGMGRPVSEEEPSSASLPSEASGSEDSGGDVLNDDEDDDGHNVEADGSDAFGVGSQDSIGEELDLSVDEISADENSGDHVQDTFSPADEYIQDPNGLNDEFFSIDEFNKQSQWFEEQDARADPNTDTLSDDDEVDWHVDPMAESRGRPTEPSSRASRINEDAPAGGDGDEDDDEAGPTFGDMDLDAPEGDSGDDLANGLEDGLEDGLDFTANDVFYKDFFAPPRKTAKKGGKERPFSKTGAPRLDEVDTERAMKDVRRDLFDDLSDRSDSEDALSDVSAGDPKSRRSAHERRQAKLAEEIRKLEAESVAKRAWTLSGEVEAGSRPINSLLEEDLDFEHTGKPVPVITEEVSESIEELIKRRILAQEFDEVIRRRPDSLGDASGGARRGLVELDDSQAKKSLAEIYEEEHVKKANPDSYTSKADEKLRQEEKEVEGMWKDVCADLDALSNWHFKPKPPAPSLTVVADVAAASMEDAQPTTAQGVEGGESMMAPQEVYKAGKATAEQGETVAKTGLPVARREMSREEKSRRRRREKERLKKSVTGAGEKVLGKKAREQHETVSDLKKAGVRVINRRGEIVDMDGKKAVATGASATSGSFKL